MEKESDAKQASSQLRLTVNEPSRATTRLGRLRLKTPRPVISAPVGPIKNSRGPDFSRSDTFVIVDGIKDCVSPVNHEGGRTISARYHKEPLSSKPTIAKSGIMATTSVQDPLPKRPANELRKASLREFPKLPRPSLKTSSTFTTFTTIPRIESPQDENTPPGQSTSDIKAASLTKIPKSRTMNVLHELKTSISRTSLNARAVSTKVVDQASSASSRSTAIPSLSSKLRLPGASQTSLCPSPRSCTPEPDPFCVDEAQPSAYWSGRFMSLWDKFSSECLNPIPPGRSAAVTRQESNDALPSVKQINPSISQHATQLPRLTTTSALTHMAYSTTPTNLTSEEDERTRRIFRHLESFCATDEARNSLQEWQQKYAQRHKRPNLVPPDRTVAEKGRVSKWLDGAQRTGRQSLSALREASTPRTAKKQTNYTNNQRSHGTRPTRF